MISTRSPSGRLPPRAEQLFRLAQDMADFANDQTEQLNFEEYSTLTELETKLLAYGNLLSAFNRDAFLDDELAQARQCLAGLHERLQLLKP